MLTKDDWSLELRAVRDLSVLPELASLGAVKIGNGPEYRLSDKMKVRVKKGDPSLYNSFTHPEVRGKGPLNLRMQVLREDFWTARRAVLDKYGPQTPAVQRELGRLPTPLARAAEPVARAAPEAAGGPTELVMPQRDDSKFGAVLLYLVHRRGLPEAAAREVFASGRAYPMSLPSKSGRMTFTGIAFVMGKDPAQPTGAQIRLTHGTFVASGAGFYIDDDPRYTAKLMAPGTRKALGAFSVAVGKADPPERIELVESAIDALSRKEILTRAGERNVAVLAHGGVDVVPENLTRYAAKHGIPVGLAYDNDAAGQRAAAKQIARLQALGIETSLHVPTAKDWNLDLVNHPAAAPPSFVPNTSREVSSHDR